VKTISYLKDNLELSSRIIALDAYSLHSEK